MSKDEMKSRKERTPHEQASRPKVFEPDAFAGALGRMSGAYAGMLGFLCSFLAGLLGGIQQPTALVRALVGGLVLFLMGRLLGFSAGRSLARFIQQRRLARAEAESAP